MIMYLIFKKYYMLIIITTFIFSLCYFLCYYKYNNSRIKYIKNEEKTAKYETNIFFKINLTAILGIDWDNVVLKQYWFDELYEKCKNIPTEKIKCN